MPRKDLDGLHGAILVAGGFEQIKLVSPHKALDEAGARTAIVSPPDSRVRGWNHRHPADLFEVEMGLPHARAEEFDALFCCRVAIPIPRPLQWSAPFVEAGKPIAAICHGPRTLINAGGVAGRKMTSWPSLHSELKMLAPSGSMRLSYVDGTLVTRRKPDDIPVSPPRWWSFSPAARPPDARPESG